MGRNTGDEVLQILKASAGNLSDINFVLTQQSQSLPCAARSKDAIEKALAAGEAAPTVGQDTRLDNRVVDLRTPANQGIFRVQSAVCQVCPWLCTSLLSAAQSGRKGHLCRTFSKHNMPFATAHSQVAHVVARQSNDTHPPLLHRPSATFC